MQGRVLQKAYCCTRILHCCVQDAAIFESAEEALEWHYLEYGSKVGEVEKGGGGCGGLGRAVPHTMCAPRPRRARANSTTWPA